MLGYDILVVKVKIEDKKIEVMRNWLQPKSIQDIQVFLNFKNFF